MSTNRKILTVIVTMLFSVTLLSIIVFTYSFKQFSIKNTTDKAISIAQNVRDGLTAHMVNGTMDKRAFFLDNIAADQKVENFHLLRAPSVVKQYGAGLYSETRASKMEKEVVKRAKIETQLIETPNKVILKVSIPYIASSSSHPDCMQCHTAAKEGDVLGVISMDLDISATRYESIFIASKILAIVFVLSIISIFIANYYIKPYIKLFDDLENGISQAYRGDFSYEVTTSLTNEAGKVAQRLNELSEIYKFKKTIELDYDKEIIYRRIIHIIQTKFDIKNFIFFEINNKNKKRKIIFDTADLRDNELDTDANLCRTFRTGTTVLSSDFDNICLHCKQKVSEYICINYKIDDEFSLVLHIQTSAKEEITRIKNNIPVINNYFEMAKPVIENKILLSMLKDTTLRDPMTSLYNRRFLNELLDSNIPSRVKEGCVHSIFMIDIDFFKKVNDTYGHDIGDKVIKRLSKVMKNCIRDADMAVRYGGEEFVILLLNSTMDVTNKIAQTIRKDFEKESFMSGSETFKKTLSVGVANYPNDGDSLWKVIKYADEALYVAKNSGRNKVVNFKAHMHKDGENY